MDEQPSIVRTVAERGEELGWPPEFVSAAREALALGDAWDEPDTGVPPCYFCRRVVPCACGDGECVCSCGRCQA